MQATGENERNSNLLAQTGSEKRGWEKFLFNLTIFLLVIFIISSIIQSLI
jgi:preprotein translocase subunit SecG